MNAALPTIVDGPSSPEKKSPCDEVNISITDSRISGADEPNAISERLAIVGFHAFTWCTASLPFTLIFTFLSLLVITSIDVMKMSAPSATPAKIQSSRNSQAMKKPAPRGVAGRKENGPPVNSQHSDSVNATVGDA